MTQIVYMQVVNSCQLPPLRVPCALIHACVAHSHLSKPEFHDCPMQPLHPHKKLFSNSSDDGQISRFHDTMSATLHPTSHAFHARPATAAQHSSPAGDALCSPTHQPCSLLFFSSNFLLCDN